MKRIVFAGLFATACAIAQPSWADVNVSIDTNRTNGCSSLQTYDTYGVKRPCVIQAPQPVIVPAFPSYSGLYNSNSVYYPPGVQRSQPVIVPAFPSYSGPYNSYRVITPAPPVYNIYIRP